MPGSLDQSCVVELGSSYAEVSYISNDQTWLEVEAQASDCGPRVDLCDVEEATKRPDWSDDAVAGYIRVDTETENPKEATFSETSWRVDFVFSLRHGGFRSLTAVAGTDATELQPLGEDVYETLQALLISLVPKFQHCFASDLARRLEELSSNEPVE
ncbi:Hypothetical protein, putative [Bodo saltans]|uniref:GSKIP domain-containing protein n=1 Tax=Bodo saltans TaxID=75058 RepID=A0A0S4JLT3_BODSA|nr:Hypothetical protein, putative [Bodo saltans]|eukprot:CUG92485.1 Hypothetical protein, putative [Bodo saltans]